MKIRNIFIIFLLTGFWHGANWTFLVWGLLNALFMIPSILLNTNRNHLNSVAQGKMFPSVRESVAMGITFSVTAFAWIFFRAENIGHALDYVSTIFSPSLFSIPEVEGSKEAVIVLVLVVFFMMMEWIGREEQFALQYINLRWKISLRWIFYFCLIVAIFIFSGKPQEFIYFQF